MLEFNFETLEEINKGLTFLQKFSGISKNIEVPLKILSPYCSMRNKAIYSIDDWTIELLASVFSETIKEYSIEGVTDGESVMSELGCTDAEVFDFYWSMFLSQRYELGLEPTDIYDDAVYDFFSDIGMKVLSFKVPFITNNTDTSQDFKTFIPRLVQDKFNISDSMYISSYMYKSADSDCVDVYIYYIESDEHEFAYYSSTDRLYEIFIDLIKEELEC